MKDRINMLELEHLIDKCKNIEENGKAAAEAACTDSRDRLAYQLGNAQGELKYFVMPFLTHLKRCLEEE